MAEREPRDEREQRPRTNDRPRRGDARSSSPRSSAPRDASHRGRPDDGKKRSSSADGKKPYGRSDDRKPHARAGEKKPYVKRDGDKPYVKREGDRPYARREGDKPYVKREGDKPYARREGDKPYARREGDKPYARREGDKPYSRRDGDAQRPRQDRPTRGGADRPDRATRPEEIRSIRPRHDDPFVPDDVTPQDLNPGARNELKTLSKENAEWVARHLAMAARLIDDDPELAHQHALSASRRAGRIAVVRETLAITAYATGDYALALRELRTYRRISGRDDQIALMVDSERGMGRPDRALETGRAVDRSILPVPVRVELAIAMSGARLDLGEADRALLELDIPEFDADRAYEWSPSLFAARATVLEELGREDEAREWQRRAVIAAEALDEASGFGDLEVIEIEEVIEIPDEDDAAEREASGSDTADTADSDAAEAGSTDDDDAEASQVAHDAVVEAPASIDDEVREILQDAGVDEAPDDEAGETEAGDRH
jgi:hypothetical protein